MLVGRKLRSVYWGLRSVPLARAPHAVFRSRALHVHDYPYAVLHAMQCMSAAARQCPHIPDWVVDDGLSGCVVSTNVVVPCISGSQRHTACQQAAGNPGGTLYYK